MWNTWSIVILKIHSCLTSVDSSHAYKANSWSADQDMNNIFGTSVRKNPFLEPSTSQFNSVHKLSNLVSLFNIHFDVTPTSCYVPYMVSSLMVPYAFLIVPIHATYSTYHKLFDVTIPVILDEGYALRSSLLYHPLYPHVPLRTIILLSSVLQ